MNILKTCKKNKSILLQSLFASFVVIFFSYSRFPVINIPYSSYVTGIGYILLIIFWLVPISKRIIDKQVRRHIIHVGCLLISLMLTRTIKWSIYYNPPVEQLMWYLYYVSILFAPYYLFLISLSINKNLYATYQSKFKYIYMINLFLVLIIVTNSYHQLVFKIIEWKVNGDIIEYMPFYYLLSAWLLIQYVVTIVVTYKNCKLPKLEKRIMAPIFVIIIFMIYLFFYRTNPTKYGVGFVEFAVAFCIADIALIESFELTGLIQSNTKYVEIFKNSEIPMMIVDKNYDVKISSKIEMGLEKAEYSKITDSTYIESGNKRVCLKSIEDGYIVWLDDMEMINKKNSELEKVNNTMLIENELLEKEFIVKKRELAIQEKNRIYDEIQTSIAEKINTVDYLIANLNEEKQTELVKICIIGAYIKRISNIILLSQMAPYINTIQLQNAIQESLLNFKIINSVEANDDFIDFNIKAELVKLIYNYFEEYLERYFDKQCKLIVNWSLEAKLFNLTWQIEASEISAIDSEQFVAKVQALGADALIARSETREVVTIIVAEEF